MRKQKIGVVVALSGKDTINVKVETLSQHPIYGKVLRLSRKYLVHDSSNKAQVGDKVSITECRPISKRKSWRLVDIIEKHVSIEG